MARPVLFWFSGALASLLLLSLNAVHSDPPKEAKKDAKKSSEPETTDFTAQAKEMNSDKFAAPPTSFRVGHVTVKALDAKAITSHAKGFEISLPSNAPIPTPTIYKGKLYASGGFHSKEYYCFDAVTGKLVWGISLDDDGPTSAVVEDGVVVFNTESCTIFAVDAETGKHLWSHWLGDPLTSTPTISKGKVYTSYPANGGGNQQNNKKDPPAGPAAKPKPRPAASHVLACLELKTGKIVWQKWIDSDVMSAPVVVENEVYATSFGGTVYRFKTDDGAILSAQCTRATSAPVIVGGEIFLTQRADGKGEKAAEKIAGIDRTKNLPKFESAKKTAEYLEAEIQGKTQFAKQAEKLDAGNGFGGGAPEAANPAAAKGNIGYSNVSSMQAFQGSRILNDKGRNFNCMGDEISCTDPSNGKLLWSVKLTGDLKKVGGFLASPPASAGGNIFLSTLDGHVLRIDPAKGDILEKYKVGQACRSQPAIVDGRIYVGTENGKIICIDTGNRAFTGWYTWGANSAHTNLAEVAKK